MTRYFRTKSGSVAESFATPTRLVVPTNHMVSAMPFWLDRRPRFRKQASIGLTGQGHSTASATRICVAHHMPSRVAPTVRFMPFEEPWSIDYGSRRDTQSLTFAL